MNHDEVLLDSIRKHEGWRSKPYYCTAGALTVGYGHNIDAMPVSKEQLAIWHEKGITREEGESLLRSDVAESVAEYKYAFGDSDTVPLEAKRVVIEMLFQLGYSRFRGFKKFIAAYKVASYNVAADEMLDSKWARSDSPGRARTLAARMRACA